MSPTNQTDDSNAGLLVSFYLGQTTDDRGRTLDEIQSWDHQKLELVHDYIQWLFPLTERSKFNPSAPLLDDQQIVSFTECSELRARVIKSFTVMLSFYGLQIADTVEGVKVTKGDQFEFRSQNWIRYGNHNYLRITRILTSLQLLGLEEYARAFLACLEQVHEEKSEEIGERTLRYWRDAVT